MNIDEQTRKEKNRKETTEHVYQQKKLYQKKQRGKRRA